ncbi:Copper Transporter integral membrane protein that functions in high affinity copper transport [Diaporthe australafricana]|uniref:Copper transport protein n=1 Tax=Diaporthe australafricana TaxID=127596 RepID=A0ABR3WAB2_9PEZI
MDMSSMDMSTSTTMDMAATGTASSAAAATTSAMSMSMGGGNSCKISMLWNWNTVDSCFISSSWHVTSSGMFAGSCVGVLLLVMLLELLRRMVKEYDALLVRKHSMNTATATATISDSNNASNTARSQTVAKESGGSGKSHDGLHVQPVGFVQGFSDGGGRFRPTVFEQAVRALLHTCQFAVAYFVMLLAMYYNGYIIICIFIGAFLGSFVFHYEWMGADGIQTSASREATVCCG